MYPSSRLPPTLGLKPAEAWFRCCRAWLLSTGKSGALRPPGPGLLRASHQDVEASAEEVTAVF